MDQDGLEQVEERLSRLRAAVDQLNSNQELKAQESAWLDVLQLHGTVYSKLEQAAKANSKSQAWFGNRKAERKADELMSYLLHARNAGEHTIKRSSEKAVWAITGTIGEVGPEGAILGVKIGADGHPTPHVSGAIQSRFVENEVLLHAAVDRGETYPPPRKHLGNDISGDTASDVASIALTYIEGMVAEARTLLDN